MLCTRSKTKPTLCCYYCNEGSSDLISPVKPCPLSNGYMLSMKDKDQWDSEERRLRHQAAAKTTGDLFRNSKKPYMGISVLDSLRCLEYLLILLIKMARLSEQSYGISRDIASTVDKMPSFR